MDVTDQPEINEAPDIAPVDIYKSTLTVEERLDTIESVLNLNQNG